MGGKERESEGSSEGEKRVGETHREDQRERESGVRGGHLVLSIRGLRYV